jgi:hypothetical protein
MTTHPKSAILQLLEDSGFSVTWEEQPFPFDIG